MNKKVAKFNEFTIDIDSNQVNFTKNESNLDIIIENPFVKISNINPNSTYIAKINAKNLADFIEYIFFEEINIIGFTDYSDIFLFKKEKNQLIICNIYSYVEFIKVKLIEFT